MTDKKQSNHDSGWLEAAIAWEVCASIHEKFAKGKDDVFTTRQRDFKRHARDARKRFKESQSKTD